MKKKSNNAFPKEKITQQLKAFEDKCFMKTAYKVSAKANCKNTYVDYITIPKRAAQLPNKVEPRNIRPLNLF
ncbi:MAG: hypothetical protein AAGU14_03555 [Eubacteriaceae bacterium]